MKYFFTLIILITLLFAYLPSAFAGCDPNDPNSSSGICLEDPLDGKGDPQVIIGKIINAVLGLVGSLALLMFIYGGLVWMTAAGASEKVQKGKDILVWAAIGMIVIFSSYAMVRFVLVEVIQ